MTVWIDEMGIEQPSVKVDRQNGSVKIHLEELDLTGDEHKEQREAMSAQRRVNQRKYEKELESQPTMIDNFMPNFVSNFLKLTGLVKVSPGDAWY